MVAWNADITLTVSLGFGSGPLAASPTFTDISSDVRRMSIHRGRGSVRQSFDAGTATIVLDNTDGEYDPNNSSATHYPNLLLGTPVRIQATYNVTTYTIFYGNVTRWPLSYPQMGKDGIVELEATENVGILRTTYLSETYATETTDTRIGNILDDAGWPAGASNLDTGVANVAAETVTEQAGRTIDRTVEAEQGQFFIAGNGDATFTNRTAYGSAASQATFNPGTNLDYVTVSVLYDDDLLINYAAVAGPSGTPREASDATSISSHGTHSYESSNDSLMDDSAALNVAEWVVSNNKDVVPRITGLTIAPQSDPSNLWPEVLGRELQDVITVVVNPPGAGDNLTQALAVESIQHDVTPGMWVTTYTSHPLAASQTDTYWILGTHDLDTETVLA